MKKYLFAAALFAALLSGTGCAAFREKHTDANPEMRFMQHRIDTVARELVRDGKAKSYEEALPMARAIVEREMAEQKAAARENESNKDYFREHTAGQPKD